MVGRGEMFRIKDDMIDFEEIEITTYKVVVWQVIDSNIELFAPNHNDDPPHLTLKDLEGTNTLWEEEHLKLNSG